ncbi:hypothetical protein X945_6040 [Burkholderia pseudomallei ABCPW 107]|nr:hypothetical protein X945_6040 [Burkholderia pseudomallei ABCPW 107]
MSRPYELSDGRYKCRSCGKKFSWTSVWDSVRLSSREKTRLLDARVLTSGEGLWTDSAHEKTDPRRPATELSDGRRPQEDRD